jgi:predicted GH43/DUF377 family glycosyl hydrolase
MLRVERLGVVLRSQDGPNGKFAKFNAGMIVQDCAVHMLYRWGEKAEPRLDYSKVYHDAPYVRNFISYARLSLDGELQYDSDRPVIYPTTPHERAGCEDARIVQFEGAYYIFYCAYDGVKPRIAAARTTDFECYCKLGIIDAHACDKDAFIFPERIDGRIALVHRIEPCIQIDYFDSFDQLLNPQQWSDYMSRIEQSTVLRPTFDWESVKIGGGVPPIKTSDGWVLIYHGVDRLRKYHAGVALLDLENPSVVRARLPYPILSPLESYEIDGHYQGCVFPQGAYLHNEHIYISYGAADENVALARVNLSELLRELSDNSV